MSHISHQCEQQAVIYRYSYDVTSSVCTTVSNTRKIRQEGGISPFRESSMSRYTRHLEGSIDLYDQTTNQTTISHKSTSSPYTQQTEGKNLDKPWSKHSASRDILTYRIHDDRETNKYSMLMNLEIKNCNFGIWTSQSLSKAH